MRKITICTIAVFTITFLSALRIGYSDCEPAPFVIYSNGILTDKFKPNKTNKH